MRIHTDTLTHGSITGVVLSTDGRHPVSSVEVATGAGVLKFKIPHGQTVGYAIDNSEFRQAAHTFRVDGRHLLAVVREDT